MKHQPKKIKRNFIILLVASIIFACMPTTVFAATTNKNINVTTNVGISIKLKPTISNPTWSVGNKNLVDFNSSTKTFKALASGSTTIKATSKDKKKTETFCINIKTNTKNSANVFNQSIVGSTIWPIVNVNIYKNSDLKTKTATINALTKGTVKETKGDIFKITCGSKTGWVNAKYLMINLPDVRSDIKYNITNAYSSIFKIGGSENKCQIKKYNSYQSKDTAYTKGAVSISNITGKKLYTYDTDGNNDGKVYNSKLKRNEFVCPVLYKFAKKIGKSQNIAIQNGYCLKIYDGYRPQSVCNSFWTNTSKTATSSQKANWLTSARVSGNGTCYTNGYTNITCFAAKGISDHARGYAIDVTMVYSKTGKEIPTQSPMHDLSSNSVKWVNKGNKTSWGTASTDILNTIMTSVGMKPLAYEWWHFSDPSLNVGYGNSNIKY